jgi:hypothetical protein
MTRANKGLIVVMVAALGLWGCAKGSGGHSTAQAERIRALEGKCARFEEDYRAVAAARDQARKRLAGLEEERARMRKELDLQRKVVAERDLLAQQVRVRVSERDALQLRCDRLKKGLQNLLGQDDALLPAANPPAVSTAAAAPGHRS